jgi:hypothetical protein
MAQPVSLTLTGVSISPWKNANFREAAFHLGINCFVTGTVTYNIETTDSDYLTPGVTVNVSPTTIAAAAASAFLSVTTPCRAWRLNILTGTGSVTAEAVQSGY